MCTSPECCKWNERPTEDYLEVTSTKIKLLTLDKRLEVEKVQLILS